MLNQTNKHIPDILDCIANLSNDEVFTSPKLVNEMLDMLPQKLFSSTETKFLDPFCKSGVFLREIVKRLDKGLENKITDKQERIDHIMHKQVFGIAITELTALLSRRTLYCSKYACSLENDIWINIDDDGIHETHSYSVSEFTKNDINAFCLNPVFGNIRFVKVKHKYDNKGICQCCGANNSIYKDLDYAYEFIHINEQTLEVFKRMEFDVIIGNPPYQLADGNIDASSAMPIYHIFVEQAKKLQPRYLSMIIPSRWMVGGRNLDDFRTIMLNDKHITVLHDFVNSTDCFTGVDIKGGVCYFLRDRDKEAKCKITTHYANEEKTSVRYLKEDGVDVFIRQPELIAIKEQVWNGTGQQSFSDIVSTVEPYGFRADFFNPFEQIFDEKLNKKIKIQTTTEKKYNLMSSSETPIDGGYEILGLLSNKRVWRYLPKDYHFKKTRALGKYKIFISKAYGCGAIGECPSMPVIGTPLQVCTETFREIGSWDTEFEATSCLKYIQTKFFRALVSIKKQTQNTSVDTYKYVPIQDFTAHSDIDWSQSVDAINLQLYKKYKLSEDSIAFIEDNIVPMNETSSCFDIKDISSPI